MAETTHTRAGGVLGAIVDRKRIDVKARLGVATAAELSGRAERSMRSLAAALGQPGARFIMEIKRASPSGGALRGAADASQLARAYAGVADAVSVLTDTPFFGGSLADLAAARAAFDGPLLCKDFIVDPRQIAEARLYGADAVLIMLSVLDDDEARLCLAMAGRLSMDVLVEAHDETELRRAVALGAGIIGINNRDLRTLKVDLAITERLAALVPADRILVSESGIASRADVERLGRHADAFLVGSSLMRAADPAAAARALVFGPVKICGVTNLADLEGAWRCGATYGGLIMVPGTPRHVDEEAAKPFAAASILPLVGVFGDAPIEEVEMAARNLRLAAVQLHGRENGSYISALARRLPGGCEIWAAAAFGDQVEPAAADATRTLFDTSVGGRSGGTGMSFDWARLAGRADLARGILAGGLNAGNAAAASRVGAFALDVGSGVESAPRRKDAAKLKAFFGALRPAARGEATPC